ncbi:hypothetical protein Acor_75520 [Acrocarpospora corrugata]|uniref:Uncharacterized protein n=1 Tax=Acrocarpospora corrugata TaxID=35763 RepID=A0A5M3W9D7_9ACTN|nr:hypothetical protein [Acrocarpospora corrugata]GES05484.1 hypothetical protein Acor_75520 [Acrocarpospora corrugata]
MASVIERADQLVLDFISKVADLAHGRMRPEQRLDFVRRVRERVEEERAGSEDPKAVLRMLARFGTPEQLVEREVRRLANIAGESGEPSEPAPTRTFPSVDDGTPPRRRSTPVPPGVMHYRQEARRRLAGRSGRGPSAFNRLRQAAMAGGNPMATRDAWSIFADNRREAVGLALFVLGALLVPFRLPSVAIFPVPGLLWAVGAVVVLSCEGWVFNDRLLGLSAPVAAYLLGGGGLALIRVQGTDLGRFMTEFHGVSGVMFIIGTAAGVTWLIYRLLDPPPGPPSRTLRVTR